MSLLSPLCDLFTTIWKYETFPADWKTSTLMPLPKNGDKSICGNYRAISLLDTAAKLFATILLDRFSLERHSRIRRNQAGFRPGKGYADQMFTLRRLLEHRAMYQRPTAACFIDSGSGVIVERNVSK